MGSETAESSASGSTWQGHALVAALIVALALLFGAGGYLLGKSSGEDLDAARAAGKAVGHIQGTQRGTKRGYAAGYRRGQASGMNSSYDSAYVRAYRGAFTSAGLAAPAQGEITVEGP